MSDLNPNCSGSHCTRADGEVRKYALGGGANLYLCQSCWAHENRYRYYRGVETKAPERWPQLNWFDAEVYDGNGV